MIFSRKKAIYLLVLVAFIYTQAAYGKMYRWVDSEGKVFYSDQVPPKHVKHKRESINEKGNVVEITEAEKSKEQWELEKRLEILRKAQEKIIAKQKSHDKVLLSTFRTFDDMQMTLQGKMLAFDAQRRVSEGTLNQLENQLQAQQSAAAKHERSGHKAPELVINEIHATEEQIQQKITEINMHNEKKRRAKEVFLADIERFKFLKQVDSDREGLSDETAAFKAADELGLFACISEMQCKYAWDAARIFVKKYSTVKIDVDTDKLIMSGDPATENDISLSVSKMIRKNTNPQIFLDIRCRKSSLGMELCSSQKIRRLRSSFSPFIKSALLAY